VPRTDFFSRIDVGFSQGVIMKDAHEAVADFGKAATTVHTLIHKSVVLTDVEVTFIARQLDSLGIVLRMHYPKKAGWG
jgi:hypothetical protein